MAFSANNQRRRDEQAAKWAALSPNERQRIEAQNVVESKIRAEAGRKVLDADRNTPRRLRDLPEDELESFKSYLIGKNVPRDQRFPDKEQDLYWPTDYRRWKSGLEPLD